MFESLAILVAQTSDRSLRAVFLPPQLSALQCCRSDIPQNYLLAEDDATMYAAFMGTKQARDILTDLTFVHRAIWAEAAATLETTQAATAHRGFLTRANAIDVMQLYALAKARGKRLVLCGHSLGGAVAKLCTLKLLRELPQWPAPDIKCVSFATPAVGNRSLAELVDVSGWDR